jgi:hypothetical protein
MYVHKVEASCAEDDKTVCGTIYYMSLNSIVSMWSEPQVDNVLFRLVLRPSLGLRPPWAGGLFAVWAHSPLEHEAGPPWTTGHPSLDSRSSLLGFKASLNSLLGWRLSLP